MPRLLAKLVASCLFLLFACIPVFAQSSTATLSGTIEDENGAVIPGAAIAVVNEATSFKRTATTNESGSFSIPLLSPGEYTVLVEREGFTRVQLTNIVLNVGDQKAVRVQLKVGDVASTVEVRADASLVSTDGGVGTVIDRQFVQNIPLNGRSFQSLLELTPGVVITPAISGPEGGQFSVNGQRASANVFTVDGVSANVGIPSSGTSTFAGQSGSGQLPGLTASGTTASLVAVEALQEFRIQSSSYAPEFGRQPGGQISLVTRSGGNDFHGSAFEFFRNEAFDANNWFNNQNKQPKPPTRQHQFGGTFSGPLPFLNFGEGGGSLFHSGKDRTHFFFSYEGLRLRLPKSALLRVPTLCLRGEATCPAGQSAALEQYQPYLRVFPLPNGDYVGNGYARFSATYSDPSSYDATSVRVDHTTGKLTFFGRFSTTPSKASVRDLFSLSSTNNSTQDLTSLTAGSTQTLTKAIVNDVRVNYTTNFGPGFIQPDDFGGGVPLSTFGFVGRSPETNRFVFQIDGLGFTSAQAVGNNTGYKQRQFNIVENLMVSAGDHQLKFGVDYRVVSPILHAGARESLVLNVANLTSGNALSGRAASYTIGLSDDNVAVYPNLSVYAQDTWRVNRRLTLTYGVRWELVPPPHSAVNKPPVVFEGLDDPYGPAGVRLAPEGTPLWETRYFNVAPRFGASYLVVNKPGRELVVRGGGGIFYDLGLGQSSELFRNGQFPTFGFGSLRFPTPGHPDPACAGTTISFPLPACALDTSPSSLAAGNWNTMDRNIALPRTYQWNAAAEQSLGSNQTVTVSYVGAAGRQLLRKEIYPGVRVPGIATGFVSDLDINRNGGRSDYEALQVQFQRRLSHGIQGLVSYTFGRSRDTESSDVSSVRIANAQTAVTPDSNYGYSNFDVRHILTGAATYQLPNVKGGSFAESILSNWGVDLMFRARTAFPVNDIQFSTPVPGLPGNTSVRPNLIPGVPIYVDDLNAPGGRRLNSDIPSVEQIAVAGCRPRGSQTPAVGAFCAPPLGEQGNLQRGLVRGFGAKQLDISLRRDFALHEKVRLQLKGDVFNVFNWPNFANPRGIFGSTSNALNYGSATQTLNVGLSGLSALYQIGGPRSMQFSARVSF